MQDELETLIAAWQAAWFDKNAAAIEQMMAEDYVYIAPNGTILDRRAILQIVGDSTYGITEGKHSETMVVMLSQGAALVRHRWKGTAIFRGQSFVEDHRCVTVCDRSTGAWRIRYEQCSAISGKS
jgi:ketosteroid isomerase-like protein